MNLEMSSDMSSSHNLAQDLRMSIFDIAREPDISNKPDSVGHLTNFGLRILFSDALDKNDTKRQLYGDALCELNRRLLVLNNWTGEASNPGTIGWGDPMPSNLDEDVRVDTFALDAEIVDKETVYNARYKERYGVEWDQIQKNLAKQKVAKTAAQPEPDIPISLNAELTQMNKENAGISTSLQASPTSPMTMPQKMPVNAGG
jgi:hypothetical protein